MTAAAGRPEAADEMATAAESDAVSPGVRTDVAEEEGAARTGPSTTAAATPDPWAPLLAAGMKILESLTAPGPAGPGGVDARSWIETDERTGKSYLKLPVPEPAAVQRLADALAALLGGAEQR